VAALNETLSRLRRVQPAVQVVLIDYWVAAETEAIGFDDRQAHVLWDNASAAERVPQSSGNQIPGKRLMFH
jgi:hypothetical protein